VRTRSARMLDFIFLFTGVAVFVVFAAYAAALRRL
jgi:hypothetical protein